MQSGERADVAPLTRGEPVIDAVLDTCPVACREYLLFALERNRVRMLLGFEKGKNGATPTDLAALATLADAAFRPALGTGCDASQLATVREIISGIGHDVGTPLNVISGYSEHMLMGTAEGMKGHKELSSIVEQSRRVAQMIRQMLDIVRVPVGVHRQSRPLQTFCDELLQITAYMFRKAHVRCQVEGKVSDHAKVEGDLPLLYQTAFNVLSCAAHAAGSGGRVTIRPVEGESGLGLTIHAFDAEHEQVDLVPLCGLYAEATERERGGLELADRVLAAHDGELAPLGDAGLSPDAIFLRLGSVTK
jgi:signal transduction histidine kinase